METRFHAVASAVVSICVFLITGSVLATGSAFVVGVLIDVDHIAMACYRHRTLAPITVAVKHAFSFSLPAIFDQYPIYSVPTIISVHILGAVVLSVLGGLYSLTVGLAIGSSLVVHILMDVYDARMHLF